MGEKLNAEKKQLLNLKNIKRDLKGSTLALLVATVILLIVAIVLLRVVLFVKLDNIMKCVYWFFSLMACSATVSTLIATICTYQRRRKFEIITDKIVALNVICEKFLGIPKETKFEFGFENNGEYVICEQLYGAKNYRWSKICKMSNTELFESTNLDDEFYLVKSLGKKAQILLIYNKNRFELEEN